MRYISLIVLFAFTGCGTYHATVYGASGRAFTAPDICAALIACKNSAETSCYYYRSVVTEPNGSRVEDGCKEVTK